MPAATLWLDGLGECQVVVIRILHSELAHTILDHLRAPGKLHATPELVRERLDVLGVKVKSPTADRLRRSASGWLGVELQHDSVVIHLGPGGSLLFTMAACEFKAELAIERQGLGHVLDEKGRDQSRVELAGRHGAFSSVWRPTPLHIRRFHAHQAQHQVDLTPVMNFMLLYTMDKNPSS